MTAAEGWETKRFDELGTIFSGSTPSTSIHSFWDGEIVWVTPNDLSKLNTPYLHGSAKRITEKGLNGCSAHLLPAGSLVMSSRAPIGYVALPTVQFCTNQGCKTIKLKSAFHAEFTYYNVLFNIHKIKNLGEGTTFAEISKTALSTIELSFPTSLPEQAKIAKILSTVDRAIEQTEALIAKQQRIKTGLMQDLLTRGIDEHGNLRSEQTHQFKGSPVGRIPVEWEVEPFGVACERVVVGIATSTTKHFRTEGIPLLRNQNVIDGKFDLGDLLHIAPEFDAVNRSKRLKQGDLVTMRTGYPGRTAVASSLMTGWQTFTTLISTPKRTKYLSEFLCFQLNSFIGRTQIATLQGGGAQQNLNVGWVVNVNVLKPSLEEQENAISLLSKVDERLATDADHHQKLCSLKTALMQDLLTGKKRVTALMDDVGLRIDGHNKAGAGKQPMPKMGTHKTGRHRGLPLRGGERYDA